MCFYHLFITVSGTAIPANVMLLAEVALGCSKAEARGEPRRL